MKTNKKPITNQIELKIMGFDLALDLNEESIIQNMTVYSSKEGEEDLVLNEYFSEKSLWELEAHAQNHINENFAELELQGVL